MKIRWNILIASFVIVFLVASVGSYFTQNVKTTWYETIKPGITPPNFVFPIVWSILFALIALSLYFSWNKAKDKSELALAFGANFFVNITWSVIYFYLKNPLFAFFNIILLIASIGILIYVTRKTDKLSSWLLVPYLLWGLFASILNYLSI
jgi:tryptophan-rich sensory protein